MKRWPQKGSDVNKQVRLTEVYLSRSYNNSAPVYIMELQKIWTKALQVQKPCMLCNCQFKGMFGCSYPLHSTIQLQLFIYVQIQECQNTLSNITFPASNL